eukprot:3770556-Lingulodinium_polyedra.AAC.1
MGSSMVARRGAMVSMASRGSGNRAAPGQRLAPPPKDNVLPSKTARLGGPTPGHARRSPERTRLATLCGHFFSESSSRRTGNRPSWTAANHRGRKCKPWWRSQCV